jgi:hypothetical protein
MTNDYCSNYTVGNIDVNQRLRAINRAIEDVHRCLGLTCDENIFNFQYTQDNMFTSLPIDFDEPILLYYVNSSYNLGGQSGWQWNQYTRLLQTSGVGSGKGWGNGMPLSNYGQKWFSSTNINGSKQLVQTGANILTGSIVNPYNTSNLTTGTGDTTNLAVDNNVYINGGGSLSFTIDPTLGHGYAGIKTTGFGLMSVQQALKQNGIYKVYSYLPTTAISNVELILTSSPGNTYTFTATTNDDGTVFVNSIWNRQQFQWGLVSIAGSPNSQQITSYEIRYTEGGTFGAVAIPYFRIDNLYLVYPDNMNLIYYSQFKGTDTTGTINKIVLDALTDLPNFMQFFPDFLNMVALRAAYILMPQLSGDVQFMTMYKSDYVEQLKDYGKIYPRKRTVNLGSTQLRRP